MTRPAKPAPKAPRKLRDELLAKRNRRLANQTRRLLSKHYAAKYRVR
jgi:hypothetical protein